MFSFRQKKLDRFQWAKWSIYALGLHFVIGLVLVMVLNGKVVNHSLVPIFQFTGMFSLLWPEHPLASLHFLATKSLFAFAHHDMRSGLNLWTLEYDSYTLLVYIGLSLIFGWIVATSRERATTIPSSAIITCVAGITFISLSISYMSVIDHCSGATWVGFVTLYGMGFNEFELYPAYQIVCAAIGILTLIAGLLWLNASKNRGFS